MSGKFGGLSYSVTLEGATPAGDTNDSIGEAFRSARQETESVVPISDTAHQGCRIGVCLVLTALALTALGKCNE